ncbi:MAG: hypothetical protein ACP5T6_01990 [Candidatus Micrarchaeia archaeon]
MPIKYNLTKFDVLANKVKKIIQSRNHELTEEDLVTIRKAVIIASFASGHSWKTYKIISSNKQIMENINEVIEEYKEAQKNRWKAITSFDIVEVANANIGDNTFSQWLYSCVDKSEHHDYQNAWSELKKEFNEACDDVPKKEA